MPELKDMFSKSIKYDDQKFRELILYICQKSEGDKKFGATKLNKLLFYCDFICYRATGKSMTGLPYKARDYGPASTALVPIRNQMIEDGELAQAEREYHGKTQHVLQARRSADLKGFTGEEIELVNSIIQECWNKDATRISDMSHKFIGWQVAKRDEEIPYATALVNNKVEVTDFVRETGERLEPIAKRFLKKTKR